MAGFASYPSVFLYFYWVPQQTGVLGVFPCSVIQLSPNGPPPPIIGCSHACRIFTTASTMPPEVREKVRVQPSKTKARTQSTVAFEPGRDSQKLLRRYIDEADLVSTDFLFTSTRRQTTPRAPISERAYLNLVKKWVGYAGLNPEAYRTHSIRRSRPAYLYRKTGNLRACQIMLGHSTIASTQKYLGVEEEETLALARQFELSLVVRDVPQWFPYSESTFVSAIAFNRSAPTSYSRASQDVSGHDCQPIVRILVSLHASCRSTVGRG